MPLTTAGVKQCWTVWSAIGLAVLTVGAWSFWPLAYLSLPAAVIALVLAIRSKDPVTATFRFVLALGALVSILVSGYALLLMCGIAAYFSLGLLGTF